MTTLHRTVCAAVAAFALVIALPVSAQTTDARIAVLLAQIQSLQAQIAILKGGGIGITFMTDMTIGSSGTEVSRLQSFLISRGHVIPAGATGYFGTQTASAVAAFQAAQGISPPAGYFGPLTRARANVIITASIPTPVPDNDVDEDDDDSDNVDEDDAEDAIQDLEDLIADAQDDIDEAEDDGEDVDEANDLLDEARDLLEDAEEAFDDEDFDEVMDLIDEAEDLVDEALDEADVDENDDEDDPEVSDDVEASADTTVVNGSNNDYATFEMEITLEAFGEDIYLSQNGDTAFTYRIEDGSNGSVIVGADSQTEVISSSADTEGNYYRIDEGSEESFTITVTFDPEAADEGKSVRMQLLTLEYNNNPAPPSSVWNATPSGDYETPATYIND